MSKDKKYVCTIINLNLCAFGLFCIYERYDNVIIDALGWAGVIFLLYFSVKLFQEADEQPYIDRLSEEVKLYSDRWIEACKCCKEATDALQEKENEIAGLNAKLAAQKQNIIDSEYNSVKKKY